ncbi:hypothetical protein FNV66_35645 [Streptomyces sp. S1D4-14]|nr:hypothetical protein FNV67_36630 [Streptomyces sp. S1D4-20]QDN73921.1 hypothetical protein FNV66_35645 [Streptomyces sp. S1D4-14]QDO56510.1 hypothetical protein FNV60_34130 [Streptomyces sp. RLB3-5]QDO66412.1 hypothetical protein FNV59_36385 [Streptomyces sp. RLB1-8]
MAWQAARREHQRAEPATDAQGPPRLREFFDPAPDIVAAVFHTVLGAAGAGLFGMSGQISGAYAAIAVGVSAPALLTQLGRVQTISEVVTGTSPGITPSSVESTSLQPQPAGSPARPATSSGLGQEGAA